MLLNDPAGLSLAWCFHLSDAFHRCGVRHAFISPGSRSTPITLALAHHPGISCHSVLDERSAAFMALGAGKQSGIPALFVCTSGTAVANALPAVIEARMSASPLIVLSADRPPKLRAIGASQTIDQIKIFGGYPLFFFDTGEPVHTAADFERLGRLAHQAYDHAACAGGPVHLNLPFRKPLEPSEDQIRQCVDHYCGTINNRLQPPFTPPETLTGDLSVVPRTLQELISASRRPLVVAGPVPRYHTRFTSGSEMKRVSPSLPPSDPSLPHTGKLSGKGQQVSSGFSFFDWCHRNRIPVLSETGGIPGAVTRHPLILKQKKDPELLYPDLILRIGGSPVHRPTLEALQSWQEPQIVFRDHPDYPDTTLTTTHRLTQPYWNYDWESFNPSLHYSGEHSDKKPGTNPSDKIRSDSSQLKSNDQESPYKNYCEEWHRRDQQAVTEIQSRLSKSRHFTDGHVFQRLLPLLASEPDLQIVLSNSCIIRDYPVFGTDEVVSAFPVIVNRGASGIDGLTSTAAGAAIAGGIPTVLFTGDLAFLHDITALNNLLSRNLKLKIVVINNGGGTIFRMLPFETRDEIYREFVETQQQVVIPDLIRAHGIACETIESADKLERAWLRINEQSVGILECRTHTDASMRIRVSV